MLDLVVYDLRPTRCTLYMCDDRLLEGAPCTCVLTGYCFGQAQGRSGVLISQGG